MNFETMETLEYLRYKLAQKSNRVNTRYKYYEMKEVKVDPGNVIPPKLKNAYKSVLGWCGKSVDALADRIVFDGFDESTDRFGFNDIFRMNNPDILADSAVLSALISSCCFVYISPDEDGFPRLQVIDGGNATGIVDPITALLEVGYAVLDRNELGTPTKEALFTKDETIYIYTEKGEQPVMDVVDNPTEIPLLVPIIYRPDATRPFGHSRISRTCMSIQDKAKVVLTRADITSEYYSFPQKYVLGLSQDAEPMDGMKASISAMLQFMKDEDGDRPTIGQFTQQSVEPHISQLKMLASLFAGETGLTLDDLGFVTSNPSSAEAIKSAHDNLRLTARKAQRTFGTGFINVGYVASCLRDKQAYKRNRIYDERPVWLPIFEPDAAMLSGIGDGVLKINQAHEGYFGSKNLSELTGIKAEG